MFVVIMGCGRVGARVASVMSRAGHEVTVLDINKNAFNRLDPDFAGSTLVGNGIDIDVLRNAGIERADAFAAVTQGDNRNIMAAQVAKHIFQVERVMTRIYDPLRQETFEMLGLDAISPTVLGADMFLEILDPGVRSKPSVTPDTPGTTTAMD
ncbi:MAG: trk system potassium uptake protein TrkA [Chloroflexi bacterium]|nr:trk system potassium uptake protein TrkA [Chloroflexota bacterium]